LLRRLMILGLSNLIKMDKSFFFFYLNKIKKATRKDFSPLNLYGIENG
jgi:hypothetical protein